MNHWQTALQVLDSMGYLYGAILKIGQTLVSFPDIALKGFVETLENLHYDASPMHYVIAGGSSHRIHTCCVGGSTETDFPAPAGTGSLGTTPNGPRRSDSMAKPHRELKKANHGRRPANAKGRRAKRRKVRT